MRELSLHIMDLVENGLAAGATIIRIGVMEDRKRNRLLITVADNGRGMSPETVGRVTDPFFTTRSTRRVGLGLSLFRETCKRCGGGLEINSKEGSGTKVRASLELNHIDRPPLGDMAGALWSLIAGNPKADFVYLHEVDGKTYQLDTQELKEQLDGIPITHPEVIRVLVSKTRRELAELRA